MAKLPEEVLHIKAKIKEFIDKKELDKTLSQQVTDEVLDYCKNEREDIPNFKIPKYLNSYFESARTTMQMVYNAVSDDNYMFQNFNTMKDDEFGRNGFQFAYKELCRAEENGMFFYKDDPWAAWEQNLPDCIKEISDMLTK